MCEMPIPIIRVEQHWARVPKLTIEIDWYEPPRIPNPTAEEINACPDSFRCFVCQRIKGNKKHFAGEIRCQRICRVCYPQAEDRLIRGLISFDLRNGFQVRGYPRRSYRKLKTNKVVEMSSRMKRALEESRKRLAGLEV